MFYSLIRYNIKLIHSTTQNINKYRNKLPEKSCPVTSYPIPQDSLCIQWGWCRDDVHLVIYMQVTGRPSPIQSPGFSINLKASWNTLIHQMTMTDSTPRNSLDLKHKAHKWSTSYPLSPPCLSSSSIPIILWYISSLYFMNHCLLNWYQDEIYIKYLVLNKHCRPIYYYYYILHLNTVIKTRTRNRLPQQVVRAILIYSTKN